MSEGESMNVDVKSYIANQCIVQSDSISSVIVVWKTFFHFSTLGIS